MVEAMDALIKNGFNALHLVTKQNKIEILQIENIFLRKRYFRKSYNVTEFGHVYQT